MLEASRVIRRVVKLCQKNGQRTITLFFLSLFLAGLATQPISLVVAVSAETEQRNSIQRDEKGRPLNMDLAPIPANAKNPQYDKNQKTPDFKSPTAHTAKVSDFKPAADARGSGDLSWLTKSTTYNGEPLGEVASRANKGEGLTELLDQRTANSTTSVNNKGEVVEKQFFSPQFYKQDNKWVGINTRLAEDKNAGDAGTVFGRAFGQMQSWVNSPTHFIVEGNEWNARFSPSGFERGMVRIKQGNSQIGFKPVGAKDIAPVITEEDGVQVVHYYDLWPGVDVEYLVTGDSIKENIILKNKSSANSISFEIVGATLEESQSDASTLPIFKIKGALNNEFAIAAPNLILNNYGMVTDKPVLSQSYRDGNLTVGADKDYLAALPDDAFPAVIDPSTFKSAFGTREGGKYVSLKSDGYVCPSTTCNPYAGTLYDSNSVLRDWRSAVYAPYSQFKNSNNNLISATLHLKQRISSSFWTGTTATHTYYVGHATCTNKYTGCIEGNSWNASDSVGTSGDIDVTGIYDTMIGRGDFGAWLMLGYQGSSTSSFKNFDPGTSTTSPNGSYVTFTYGGPPSAPSVSKPVENQVYVTTQPSFSLVGMSNPNGSTPLKYQFMISSDEDATGALVVSPLLNATQWTAPDNVLQDGGTYYLQVLSYDPITDTNSDWGTAVPFRVDMRTGRDKTQTYDELGPVAVDLATGNMTTSVTSHSSAATGGSLGVSLTYNSPLRSREGLVGRYWDNSSQSGSPSLTRVDQAVDFDWGLGNPGITSNDHYSARWDGYFVAPQTGTYYFGGNNDDSLVVTVNSQQLYSSSGCYTGICYGSSISLTEGQVVTIRADYVESTSPAYAHLYVKTPDGADQVAPSSWLQTGVRQADHERGMTGYYFRDDGSHSFTASGNYMFMKRTDPVVNFNWKTGSPVAGGLNDDFMVRWTGYFTPPVTGNYYFGGSGDDGYRIIVDGNTILSQWTGGSHSKTYSSAVSLTAGQSKLVTIEYYEDSSAANFSFYVKGATASILPEQLMPPALMSPQARVLPEGWNLGLDADGGVAYEFLRQTQKSAVLTDSSGSTHEYKSTGTGYKPPVNEDGQLVRNDDGTFTLQDIDGRTYVFGTDGNLVSVTSSVDDRNPAAIQYEYGSISSGPTHLYRIKDGVDPSRTMTLYYSGESQCATPPSSYDSAPPANMLCAALTNDGRTTNFYYKDDQLAYVEGPGGVDNTFEYESVNDINSQPVGYRITKIRDALANDAVNASVRSDNDTTKSLVAYDVIGRVVSVKQPAPLSSGSQLEHTIAYLPGEEAYEDSNGEMVEGYYGATEQHVVGVSEPEGYSQRIQYDALFRTVRAFDNTGNSVTHQYDNDKDLLLSSVNSLDLKSTTLYDDEDRPTDSYGPAPRSWYGSDRVPLSQYLDQVPHSTVTYDEGIIGPAVAWYDYTKQTGNTNGVLSGAPKLHTTGINTSTPGTLSYDFTSPPITAGGGALGIGFRASGKLRLVTGTYTINATLPDGIRVWADDELVIDNEWKDSASRTVTGTSFTADADKPVRLKIDVYRKTASTGTLSIRLQKTGGFTYTTDWSGYLKPDYSLKTSSTVYDDDLGDITAAPDYGSNPELGLPQSASVDPSGLNLTASSTYEAQGASGSFLRRTAKILPGNSSSNPSFSYTYYGATETRNDPCTTATEAYKQAGFLKIKTEADPDGSGSQTGRSMEFIYDDSGNIVASRYNSENWTCTEYDSRGRLAHTHIQAYGSQTDRDVTNVWAMSGNPLQTASYDANGWIITTVDLLGRTTSYTDTYGDWTGYEYNSADLLIRKYGDMGEEIFDYDSYHRLATQVFNGTTYATVTYDTYGRVDHVDYNNAGQMRLTNSYDTLGRANQRTYRLGDGTTVVTDTAEFSQGNRMEGTTVQSGSTSLAYDYNYDAAGRLTAATIGTHSYAYGFGAQDSSCGSAGNMNANSGKNSNRTSQTVDSVTTTYCYDYADRLVSSSDATANNPAYDSRGNTTSIGTGTKPLNLCYDSSNRNWCLVDYSSSGNGNGNYYSRDLQGRIVYREHDTISNWNWNMDKQLWYGYTGSGSSPDFTRSSGWVITEQYLRLPGGVLVTLKPQESQTNDKKQYSLSSIQGHTLLTTNAAGTNTSNGNGPLSSFTYDPYGNPLSGSVLPANTTNGSYGYAGANQKLTETTLDLKPIQMGARVYLSTLGRFTSPDPIEGGTPNGYVYVVDPVNTSDYNGTMCMPQGQNPFDFFNCRYNKQFEQTGSAVADATLKVGVAGAVGAGAVIIGVVAPEALAPLVVRATPVVSNLIIRTGPTTQGAPNRISLGPAPKYFKDLPTVLKIITPLHIHIESTKVWIDFNWVNKGLPLFKSSWFSWIKNILK